MSYRENLSVNEVLTIEKNMSGKTSLFRSLLLEQLECRAVFSADGFEWQFASYASNSEFAPFQPTQLIASQSAAQRIDVQIKVIQYSEIDRSIEIRGAYCDRWSSNHDASIFRDRADDDLNQLPPAEGEGRPFNVNPRGSNSNDLPAILSIAPRETRVLIITFIDSSRPSSSPSQRPDLTPTNFLGTQVGSSNSNQPNNRPPNFGGGTNSPERGATSFSQNPAVATPILAASNSVTKSNLAALNLSPPTSDTTTIDFALQQASNREGLALSGLGSRRANELYLTKLQTVPSSSLFDPTLIERAAGVESLENLLSNLAENRRRQRIPDQLDDHRPKSPSGENWRSEQNAPTVEMTFAGGGMIALALNRDVALSELEEISEDARGESEAWVANVGVYRAFENGAVAATEYAGLTNRVSRNADSSSMASELSEVEGEVANTRLHPLLASTSAALGAVMFGLRRMRKATPLLFTSRKS